MSIQGQAHTHEEEKHADSVDRDTAYDGTPFLGFVTCNNSQNNSQEGEIVPFNPTAELPVAALPVSIEQRNDNSLLIDPTIAANVFESLEAL